MKPSLRPSFLVLSSRFCVSSFLLLATLQAHAADGSWSADAAANWSDTTRWSGGIVADGADFTASLTAELTAARTITLDTVRTIGNITFTDGATPDFNLTLGGANTLTLDVTTGSPTINVTQSGRELFITPPVAGNDGLTKTGPGNFRLSGVNTLTGPIVVSQGNLRIANYAGLDAYTGTLTVSGGTAGLDIVQVGTGTTSDSYSQNVSLHGFLRTIGGNSTNLLNLTWSGNITLAGNSTITNNGNSTIVVTGAVDLGANTLTYQADRAGSRIDGAISGTGGLTKTSAQDLALAGANTYTGPTLVNAGTLLFNSGNALSTTSGITIAGGATLGSTGNGLTLSTPITLGAANTNSIIAYSRSTAAVGTLTINSSISGDANLVLSTPNVASNGNVQTIALNTVCAHTGATTLTTGNVNNTLTIRADLDNVFPTSTVLAINGGAGAGSGRAITLDLNGKNQTLAGLTNTAGLSLRNQRVTNSAATLSVLTINNSADFTFGGLVTGTTNASAQIQGNLALVKKGAGTFTLAAGAANTFTGSTTVLGGLLVLGHATSLQSSPVDTAASVTADAANGLQTALPAITLGGLTGNKNLSSVFTPGNYVIFTALTLNPASGATHSYSGSITDGDGMSLTKSGSGTQELAGANSYSGVTTVTAGSLRVAHASALGTTAAGTLVNGTTTGSSGNARLELSGGVTVSGEAVSLKGVGNFTGALSSFSGDNTWAGSVTIAEAGARLGTAAGATLRVTGTVDSGVDTFGLTVRTSDLTGVVVLSAVNTYLGDTNIPVGKLQLSGGDNRLPTSTRLTMGAGTNPAEFDLNGRNQEVAGLTLNSGATGANNAINNSSATLATLTVNTAAAAPSTFDGLLTGNLALVKNGPETLSLGGANTRTGNTTVNAGTLGVSTAGFADTSTVSVAAGAVLNLNFAGTDTVASLVLNGVAQAPGVYDAANTAGLITGTGSITVPVAGPSLASFTTSNFTVEEQGNPAVSGPTADPDGDGISNVLEYAFGMDPRAAGRANLPVGNTVIETGSTYVGAVYTRVKGATDLTFTVQFANTPDSSGFTDAVAGVDYTLVGTVDNGSTETITIRDNTPLNAAQKRFVRILVTYP